MHARAPIATYRLQMNAQFTFADASEILDYLHSLGITHAYLSPLLKARAGSSHGYDVTDHGGLNPEIGSEKDLATFHEKLADRGMAILLDSVPNHMCIAGSENRWWLDVMEDGPGSPFARTFDIDWEPPKAELAHKVLLPVLGDQYGRVLEKQEIKITYRDGAFSTEYYDLKLPVAPKSWKAILEPAVEAVRQTRADDDLVLLELESILTATRNLPGRTETAPERVKERQREKMLLKRRLKALVDANPDVAGAIGASLADLNGTVGIPRSFDRLEQLLAEQAYRLSYWRVASDEINYRRFFTVNDLAAIRVEDPEVFARVHELLFRLISKGWVQGVRVDHPDGLFDPARYLKDLQQGALAAVTQAIAENADTSTSVATDGGGPGESTRPLYVIVEKILGRNEDIQPDWPVHGTTGYEFLNALNGLFVDAAAERAFRSLYERFTDVACDVPDLIYECKKFILEISLSSELHVLARRLDGISEQHRWSRDFTLNSLHDALSEIIACFPVYRTYTPSVDQPVSSDDRRHIMAAIRTAKRRNPATNESLFDFIGSVMLLEGLEALEEEHRADRREFVLKLQQLTGPVMAKGVEDTAFYRYFPLASLNEVGSELEWFGAAVEKFHQRNQARLESWPHSLLATATHDTKRGEDVRARINVLTEIPEEWSEAIGRWREANREHKSRVEGAEVPAPNDEYLFYQTLVGTYPFDPMDARSHLNYVGRLQAYMNKAIKEASLRTSWINPNEAYEKGMRDFVDGALRPSEENVFLKDFETFHAPLARAGMLNSMAQVVLKIASPGVPDFYQGTETWDLSLVDPDNRRPVNFSRLGGVLYGLGEIGSVASGALLEELLARPQDGRVKVYLVSRALCCRGRNRDLFEKGDYLPLQARGKLADHVIGFGRAWRGGTFIVAAARFCMKLGDPASVRMQGDVWSGTHLPLPEDQAKVTYRDIFTGVEIEPVEKLGALELPLEEVFGNLPVAMLEPLP